MDPPASVPLNVALVTDWLEALDVFDKGRLHAALACFQKIEPKSSKICYNMGSIHATLGDYDSAIASFKAAIATDRYMAIAYFQVGVCRFLTGHYKKALGSFNIALKLLRGNPVVNYQQLGLDYKLYLCEIMYNRALSYIYSGQLTKGIYELEHAAKARKYIAEHAILDEVRAHFSKMETSGVGSDLESDDQDLCSALEMSLNRDRSRDRLSILGPAKADYFAPGQDRPTKPTKPALKIITPSGTDTASGLAPNSIQPAKRYPLFSVPQGLLFRLTTIKVQSVLNDNYLETLVQGTTVPPPEPYHHTSDTIPKEQTISRRRQQRQQKRIQKEPPIVLAKPPPPKNRLKRVSEESSPGTTSTSTNSPDSYFSATQSDRSSESMSMSTTRGSSSDGETLAATAPASQTSANSSPFMKKPPVFPASLNTRPAVATVPEEKRSAPPELYYDEIPSTHDFGSLTTRALNEASSPPKPKQTDKTAFPRLGSDQANQAQTRIPPPPKLQPPKPPTALKKKTGKNRSLPSLPKVAPSPGPTPNPALVTAPPAPAGAGGTPIKVKIIYDRDTLVTVVDNSLFPDFKSRVAAKVHAASATRSDDGHDYMGKELYIRRQDEDGDLVLLRDQEDLDVALEEVGTRTANSRYVKLCVHVELVKSA